MRLSTAFLVTCLELCELAHAGPLATISLTGVIAQDPTQNTSTTIDVLGLFGPPGADLAGRPIQAFADYYPGGLYLFSECHSNPCINVYEPQGSDSLGSVYFVVVINGVERVYAPSISSGREEASFETFSNSPSYYAIYFDAFDFSGIDGDLSIYLQSPPQFGSPISTKLRVGPVQGEAAFTQGSQFEPLSFSVTKAIH